SFELGKDVANKFGSRLHSDFFEDRDASSPDLSTPSCVDARYIVTTYRAALLAPAAFHHPKTVYLKLLQDFTLEYEKPGIESSVKYWLLTDIMKVVSVSAVSDCEVQSTAGLLEEWIESLTSEEVVTMDVLMKALESCPAVLQNFRSQMVSQLTKNQRLKLLAGEEDKALRAFQRQSNRVIGSKRRHFFQIRNLQKVFTAWRMDLVYVLQANRWRKRKALCTWMLATKSLRQSRLFTDISHLNYSKSRGRRSLQKLVKHMHIMKKIKRCYTSGTEKNIRAGMGHLRIFQQKYRVRDAFSNWVSFCIMGQNQDLATRWNDTILLRRVFRIFQSYAKDEIQSREAMRRASIQQKILLKHIMDMKSSVPTTSGSVSDASLLAKQERAQQYEEARRRKGKLQKEIDADILSQQRSRRRQRVETERQKHEDEFQSSWAAQKLEAESVCLERNKTWILSPEFKNQSQKMQTEVRRSLSIKQASTMDTDRENSITSLAVIRYSFLDAKMAHKGIVPDDLFRRLGNIASPINAVPFQSALVSCGLILDPSEFEELFQAMAQYRQTNSADLSIEFDDLQVLRRLSDTFVGHEGTRWKMYVSPIHQQQLMHSIIADKKIFEKHIKKKHIRQLVNENIQDHELLKRKTNHQETAVGSGKKKSLSIESKTGKCCIDDSKAISVKES
ncbi:hypothetical protein ACHAXR_004277, partial [Thalassiosira sp. AJA248-18]